MADSHPSLANRLRHIRFIGGGSGAGKSTVARRLADAYRLRHHQVEPLSKYRDRTTPADAPLLHAFVAMDMDERWLNRSPEVMFNTFHAFQGESFDLIVDDLVSLPSHPPVLAEGFSFLPRLVAPLLSSPNQAVWLLPTPEFRRIAFESRGSTMDMAARTSSPPVALANLLARDAMFTASVRSEALTLGLRVIEVDVGLDERELVDRVAAALGLSGVVAQ